MDLLKFATLHTSLTTISMYKDIVGATFSFRIRYDLILSMVCLHSSVSSAAIAVFDVVELDVGEISLFVAIVNTGSGCSVDPTSISLLFSDIKSGICSEFCCCVALFCAVDVDITAVILPAVLTLIEFFLDVIL